MNVENVNSSDHSPVSQIATHILCILSSTVFPALISRAGPSAAADISYFSTFDVYRNGVKRPGDRNC